MKINPAIFRAYDIRGSSISDITEDVAYNIGYVFTKMTIAKDNKRIVCGIDGRISSNSLFNALSTGIIDSGGEVIFLGITPTPLLYFADINLAPAASIMITASHNPKDDNGFKIVANGKPFYGPQIQNLLEEINKTGLRDMPVKLHLNNDNIQDLSGEYISKITDKICISKNLKVVWDPANGATCNILQLLQDKLPNTNFIINKTIDGNFPAHHPDPSVFENMTQLIKTVQDMDYDLGIAFDGDGDRIGVVTKTGKMLYGDQLLCIFAKFVLERNKNATIIADVKTSQVIFDLIESYGGRPLMWKTGHTFIKTKMHETGALLAGEMSGHIFFADKYYGYDDAIYAGLRLLEILSQDALSLDEIVKLLPQTYSTPEIRLKLSGSQKFAMIDFAKEYLRKAGIKDFYDIDGLRVHCEHGWWLLRPSNTEDVIVVRVESSTQNGLEILKADVGNILMQFALRIS